MSSTRIRFDVDFDAGAWPGPLETCDALAGEAWMGPLGLLEHLETMLGLPGLTASHQERAASLVASLGQRGEFWSGHADADPLGSARGLLRWNDEPVCNRSVVLDDVDDRVPLCGNCRAGQSTTHKPC